MRTEQEVLQERSKVNYKISLCNSRIRNTVNPKTEEKIVKEKTELILRSDQLEEELKNIKENKHVNSITR